MFTKYIISLILHIYSQRLYLRYCIYFFLNWISCFFFLLQMSETRIKKMWTKFGVFFARFFLCLSRFKSLILNYKLQLMIRIINTILYIFFIFMVQWDFLKWNVYEQKKIILNMNSILLPFQFNFSSWDFILQQKFIQK